MCSQIAKRFVEAGGRDLGREFGQSAKGKNAPIMKLA